MEALCEVVSVKVVYLVGLGQFDKMPSEVKPKQEISMRHSKITAAEASLLAGELKKPSWQSKNEGIHERVSFEDSIWGFDLAGGAYYKTPLRVTSVKPDSRADKAGIMPGDMLLRINDIDTSTLTIQEAHEIIIESGIHLRIAVTCPDDDEDTYNCYEDAIEEGYDSEEERRKQSALEKKREVHAKVSSYWSLQWPWVSKRRVIYRESNCFLVPSKYEDKHREKFPIQPTGPKVPEDIVLHSTKGDGEDALTADGEMNTDAIKTNEGINIEDLNSVSSNEKIDENSNNKEKNVEIAINGTKIEEINEVSKIYGNAESEPGHDTSIGNNLSKDNVDETFENSVNPSLNDQLDTTEEMLTDFEDMTESVKENGLSEDLSDLEEASREDELSNEVLEENEKSHSDDKIIDEILSNGGDDTISESLDDGR